MVIGIFGESCTGKSAIADEISRMVKATVFSGKDYIRLAKNEADAEKQFFELLKNNEATNELYLYVISEKEHLLFLPEKACRVLVTAPLDVIKERFSMRMNGSLPAPVAAMIEKRHGSFDNEHYNLRIDNTGISIYSACEMVLSLIKK
jgi:cytidylate kinase